MNARTSHAWIVVSLAIGLATAGLRAAPEGEKGLAEFLGLLTDLDRLTLAEPGVTSRQFSSYDRASRLGPQGQKIDWGANGDAGQYLRKEPGGEAVMAEMDGPGVIVQTWSANPQGKLHFYLDGAEKPIVFDFAAFTTGAIPEIPPPISSRDGAGCNSYLPIPYARRCVIKADRAHGQYYHFDYLTFPPGAPVRTFAWPPSAAEKEAIARTAKAWAERCGQDPSPRPGAKTAVREVTVPAGGTAVLAELEGPAAVVSFQAKLLGGGRFARRDVVLRAFWDGAERPGIDAPYGDFFASAWADVPFRSLPIGMTGEGGYCFFRMPFARSARFEAANGGTRDVPIRVEIASAREEFGDRTLCFHAKWRREAPNRTFDWPYLRCEGRGRFVGVAMNVQNPDPPWFGEGDEKVYVDGEAFPSWFGTGTEDYFCDAWGFRPFIRPQHGCPLYAEPGRTTVYRWHLGDSIPFARSFEMTIENYADNKDYSAVAYWYADARSKDFFEPAIRANRAPWPLKIPGILEAEDAAAPGAEIVSDDRLPFELSGGKGIRIAAGGEAALEIPVPERDAYRVVLLGPKGQGGPGLKAFAGGDAILEAPEGAFAAAGAAASRERVVLDKGKARIRIVVPAGGGDGLVVDAVRLEPSPHAPGAIEAERLRATPSDDAEARVVFDPDLEGLSGAAFLEAAAEEDGEWVDLDLPEDLRGKFVLAVRIVRKPQGGVFEALVGRKRIGEPLEGFAEREALSDEIVLGTADLPGGSGNDLTLKAVRKSPGSKGFSLALDYIKLRKILVEGAIEAEALKILAQDRASAQVQMLGDRWSAEGQLFCPGEEGQSVVLELPVKEAGRYELEIHFTRAADYGIVEVELDGKPVGEKFNGYNDGVVPSGKVGFGALDLAAGPHRLTFRCRAKDPRSSNFFLGVDCLVLKKS